MPNKNEEKISPGKNAHRFVRRPKHLIDNIDDEMMLNYQRARAGSGVPWEP